MRSLNNRYNQFTTKTASIQLKQDSGAGTKTPKKQRLGQSPGKSSSLAFQKSQKQSTKTSPNKPGIKQTEDVKTEKDDNVSVISEAISINNVQQVTVPSNHNLSNVQPQQISSSQVATTNISLSGTNNKKVTDKRTKTFSGQMYAKKFDKKDDNYSEQGEQHISPNRHDNLYSVQEDEHRESPFRTKKAVGRNQTMAVGMHKKPNHNFDMTATDVSKGKEKDEYFQVGGKSQNIRTFVRFRPVNRLEQELQDQGIGSYNIAFLNDKTVKTLNDSNTYNFDKIYRQDATQQQIYKEVFSEILDDAIMGYNGTLFAYGPTGSGKTWTMFGPNLEDEQQQGVIPRCAQQLFQKISQESSELEFTVKLAMLEIYKEGLGDLLRSDKQNLKIKETEKKGVFVSGLSWHEVCNDKEMIDLIQEGYGQKQTRGTALNDYSSRSHTVVQIDIAIKHDTGAEKAGRINMIDLAGSEKVGKSKAEGDSLEEAKKINLSLSCLGNVINALTTKSSHIPYRDSKLTRILQESLGGNFKTSLIVACSPHSHMQEETTMALRFATRAKTIRTQANMNIKQSQETLRIIIDQLKQELHVTQSELKHYKQVLEETRAKLQENPYGNKDAISVLDQCMNQIQQQIAIPGDSHNTIDEEEQHVAFQFFQEKKPNNDRQHNLEVKQLQSQLAEKNEKIEELEIRFLEDKKKLLDIQQKVTDLQEEKNQVEVKYAKEKSENQYKEFKIDILNKQLQSLVQKVCKNESDFSQILKERKELTESKIENYLQKDLKFQEIKLSDYFQNSVNFNFDIEFNQLEDAQKNMRNITLQECDQNMLKTFAGDIQNLNETFAMQQTSVIPEQFNQSFIGNLDFGQTLMNNNGFLKTIEFPDQIDKITGKNNMSKDLQLILLKQQIINSHIINQHLVRTINALEWKQVIEYGKYKMNSNLNTILSGHVSILEKLLKSSLDTHRKLRKRFDQIEFEHQQVRNQLLGTYQSGGGSNAKGSRIGQSAKRKQSVLLRQSQKMKLKQSQDSFQDISRDYSWVKEVQKIVEESDNNQFSLIYNQEGLQRASEELKRKNELLRRCWEESNIKQLPNQQVEESLDIQDVEKENQKEKERLQNKIMSLDQELATLRAASHQYKRAFIEEKKNRLNTKKLMEEQEVALRNNLKEENETWQNTINIIKEQYEKEIMLRQVESAKLQEKYQGITYHAIEQVQKLKNKSNIDKKDIENLAVSMSKMNEMVINTKSLFKYKGDEKTQSSQNRSSKSRENKLRKY